MNIITKSNTDRRRIAAVGMYDGVHLGHRFLIDYMQAEAKSRGLVPSVVTFSRHPLALVRPLEAPGLLTTLEERVRYLGDAGVEDIVLLSFNDNIRYMSAREFLGMLRKKFGIDALIVGFNNRFGHDRLEGFEQYREIGRELGIDVISAPEYRGKGAPISSSVIRKYLRTGEPEKAAQALGHHYAVRGIVVNGNQLGRTIGFPTANVVPVDSASIVPKGGVYAAFVTTPDGERRKAMVNIGFRPTVADENAPGKLSIEAHIFDYVGYLYDEEVVIEFVKFMRPEKKFATTDKLKSQLADDAAAARKHLKV
ncbi:MAG: riboflavin biosynthesis protein RibF [Duncaniella sp.]|nr:riboflavin biosynthesis protein RibF [Duncaniella sp.]MDE7145285.1 riboflavin biosynthesis protein RibF [Duncaniella sp.]